MSDIRKLFAHHAVKKQKVETTHSNNTVLVTKSDAADVLSTVHTASNRPSVPCTIPLVQSNSDHSNYMEQLENEKSVTMSTDVQIITLSNTTMLPKNMSSVEECSSKILLDISRTAADGPVQPRLSSFKKTKDGDRMRSFSNHWYAKFPTIEYSVIRDCVLCFVCRHFKPATAYAEPVFQEVGFRNWKKFGEKMQQHCDSVSHIDAVAQWHATNECKISGAVTVQLCTQAKNEIQRNRDAVTSITRAAMWCARQDVALRGHRESCDTNSSTDSCLLDSTVNRGNFLELLHLLKRENPETSKKLDSLPRNATYTSKDSQNEILHAASVVVREKIINEVQSNGGIYSIIADEARDNSCTEKMSVCIRYVHDGQIRERFLGFIDVFKLDAQSLATALITFLEDNNLSIKNCVGQAYDGASVMSGEFAGVQKFVRERSSYPCPYVHCHAHRLNLVLVDVAKRVDFVETMFGLFEAIYSFQSASTLRHDIFVKCQEGEDRVLNIPQQSDTRWVCKFKGVTFFKSRFKCVITALETLSKSKNGKEAAEARGLLLQFRTFQVVFGLCLFSDLLGVTNSLSVTLQTSTIDSGSCARIIDATCQTIESKRNDQYFDIIWKSAVTMANNADIDIPSLSSDLNVSKRQVQMPKHLLNDFFVTSTVGDHSTDVTLNFETRERKKCFDVLQNFSSELKRRFQKNNYVINAAMATDPKNAAFLSSQLIHEFVQKHSKQFSIDFIQLENQIGVAKNMFRTQQLQQSNVESQNVTLLEEPNALSVYCQLRKMAPAFPDLIKFFQLILCLPVSSAGAERSFSAMKRIKTYLRASMKQSRLSDIALLSIERQISGDLLDQPSVIIDKFAQMGNRRLLLNT